MTLGSWWPTIAGNIHVAGGSQVDLFKKLD
jgi:hypothetical protein